MESDQPDASSCPADELVLLGLCLSVDEKVAYNNTVSFFYLWIIWYKKLFAAYYFTD